MDDGKWDIGRLAQHYDVSIKTIFEWLKTGKIPKRISHRLPNGRRYFIPSEIMTFDQATDREVINRNGS